MSPTRREYVIRFCATRSCAHDVAQYGYVSMMKGKTVAIHGTVNYILANSVRLIPRAIVLKIARKMID